jgi:hypothetical protein
MAGAGEFLCGVIEGFYGRQWSFALREIYAAFLAHSKLNTYIYCPKGDRRLRGEWQLDWPEQQFRQLHSLAEAYRRQGVWFGIGLSPLALYRDYGRREREELRQKLEHIRKLEAPLLAILFDDMPGGLDALAARQAEIVGDVCRWCPGQRVLVCPTYYSFDPALEKYFGPMPGGYWRDLGAGLSPDVDIFWTGNQVCSPTVNVDDIEAIEQELDRPVLLWDNYPVNDGEIRSKHLYLDPLGNREPGLGDRLRGHLCNPMNQGLLSLPALLGLAELYGDADASRAWVIDCLGAPTWQQLQKDREEFLTRGLDGMGAARCEQLAQCYSELPGDAAAEVVAWLRGEYAWDPACLTG